MATEPRWTVGEYQPGTAGVPPYFLWDGQEGCKRGSFGDRDTANLVTAALTDRDYVQALTPDWKTVVARAVRELEAVPFWEWTAAGAARQALEASGLRVVLAKSRVDDDRVTALEELAYWLVSLDQSENINERARTSLSDIIGRAREALEGQKQ